MSLWTKPLKDVTFEDVKEFVAQGIPEGSRLEYKQDDTKNISKEICAFANTQGGLILIGVEEDDETHAPGDIIGTTRVDSIGASVHDAGAKVFPWIVPEVSNPLLLADDSSKAVFVVRIEPSELAPHAINNSTRVYVRNGEVNTQTDLADIDRIALMLSRRERWEAHRQKLISRAMTRFDSIGGGAVTDLSYMWCSVCPRFVLGEIASAEVCHQLASTLGEGNLRRVDGGSLGMTPPKSKSLSPTRMKSVGKLGDIFELESIGIRGQKEGELLPGFHIEWAGNLIRRAATTAAKLYSESDVMRAGPVVVSLGVKKCRSTFARHGQWHDTHILQCDDDLAFEAVVDPAGLKGVTTAGQLRPFEYELLSACALAYGLSPMPSESYEKGLTER
jgi:hypothetical protein